MKIHEYQAKEILRKYNVPVPNGSCVDLTTELNTTHTVDEANHAIKTFSKNTLSGIVGYTSDPIVSSDVSGREETMVFDEKATMITKEALLKTLCWYDNGWGFSKRILEVIDAYAKLEETSFLIFLIFSLITRKRKGIEKIKNQILTSKAIALIF